MLKQIESLNINCCCETKLYVCQPQCTSAEMRNITGNKSNFNFEFYDVHFLLHRFELFIKVGNDLS